MQLLPCFECDKPTNGKHHVVPIIYGGKRTIPLCQDCHMKIHGPSCMLRPELIKIGIKKRLDSGLSFGAPKKINNKMKIKAKELRINKHYSMRRISKELNISIGSVHAILNEERSQNQWTQHEKIK
jgi:hypothetical protein